MSRPRPHWLCFDLDGTLIDSVPDIAYSVNLMLTQLNCPSVPETMVRNWIGNGAAKLVERALRHTHDTVSDAQLSSAQALFFSAYQDNMAERSQLFPDCLSTLEYFHKQHIALACVTNKPRQFTQPLLAQMKLDVFFPVLVCGDDLSAKKPHPAPLLYALEQLAGQPQQGYMIGDSQTDMETAVRAGTGAIYVSYGYNRGVSVDEYQPIVIDELKQLIQLFG